MKKLIYPFILLLVVITANAGIKPDSTGINGSDKAMATEYLRNLIVQKKFNEAYSVARTNIRKYPGDPVMLDLEKKLVIADYQDSYLGSEIDWNSDWWKGNTDKCNPGIVPNTINQKMLMRINYYRRMAGVPDKIVFRNDLNDKCEKAALMMLANGTLSHSPPKNWHCYTKDGAEAAGHSNLSLGYADVNALNGQMEDNGEGNYFVGHRRWILNPYASVFGHGSTGYTMALWVLPVEDLNKGTGWSKPVCWPPEGYVPADLVYPRWSFSMDGVSFSDAKVSVSVNGKSVQVFMEDQAFGYSLNTLVWHVPSVNYYADGPQHYHIVVSGIKSYSSDKPVKFEYDVTPIVIGKI